MKFSFTLNDDVVGKQRPRWSSKTNRIYTPNKTAVYERKVAKACKEAMKEAGVDMAEAGTPVSVWLDVMQAMPESWSKKKKAEMCLEPSLKKPDIDNVLKSVLDALNGVAFEDDRQVFKVRVERTHGHYSKLTCYVRTGDDATEI